MDQRDLQQAADVVRRLQDQNASLSGYISYRRRLARPLHIEAEKAIEFTVGDGARANQQALCTPYVYCPFSTHSCH